MEVIVEVVGRSGAVLERRRFDSLPITLGRSYQNDVIVSDPYVDAFHGQVVDDGEGGLMLQDLGSRNGTGYGGITLNAEQARMEAGDRITLGKSHLRIFDAAQAVAEALPLSYMEVVFHRLSQFWMFLLGVVLLTGVWLLERYLTQLGEFKPLNHISDIFGLLSFVLIYGAVWALVGRIIRHDPRFFGHCMVAILAILGWRVSELLLHWSTFNFRLEAWQSYLELLLGGVILLLVMRSSLFLATHLHRWGAHLVAAVLPMVLVGVGIFQLINSDEGFRGYPKYNHQLLAPGLHLFQATERKQYVQEMESVFQFPPEDLED